MPTITAKVSDELLAYIDLVSGGNRSEYGVQGPMM